MAYSQEKNIQQLHKEAEANDAKAQYVLGENYVNGNGLEIDTI